ncbi:uncharacterized protein LOC136083340 [Hydra vulgaris]|uniref:Uncharacterized protein LOC136083340 n=1 Tax=Hydra vulgaris TaxID=6087 RepID=A0ABM4CAV3_HYDVU
MKSCGVKKLGKLQQHFSCFSHKAALHDYYQFMTTENHIDIILNISNRKEAIKLEQEKDFNKQIVVILFDIARTLSQQGFAFRVSADTTPDISHQDRLSVCVRYVNSQGKSVERLLEIEKGNDKTGLGLASQIVNILESNLLNPELIPFQSYDFASNMSGKFNGTHVKLSELVGYKIIFIPCQAHRLNTFLEHSCDANSIIESTIDILENLYVFFSSKTCHSWWTARAESVKAVWNSLEAVNIMYKLKYLTEFLEAKNLSIIDAITLIDSTMKILASIDSDDYAMNNFINKKSLVVLDTILKLTNKNLKTCISSIEPLYLLFSQPFNKLNISLGNVQKSISILPPASQGANLQDYDLVQTELEILFNTLKEDETSFNSLMEKSEEVKHILRCADQICRLALTSPVTVATNERTFSKLKLIKTHLRSTIADERLNSLMLLGVEKDIVDQLNINKIAHQWSILKNRRIKI